ncbi:MAG: redoxin domain-containing protein [Chloroflexota bacterium]
MPSLEADRARFDQLDADIVGISVDHVPVLKNWALSLGGISYPLASDFWPHGMVCSQYGVLRDDGYSERANFIVDREGRIAYIDVHDINEQPDNEELLEVLRGL